MKSYKILLRKRKIIRYSCLIFGIIIVSYTAYKLTNNMHNLLKENHVTLQEVGNNSKEFSFQVDKPIFEGVNSSNQAYKISAYNVVKTSDIYLLEEVEGEYELGVDQKIQFFSKQGNFNDHTKDLHLNNDVRIIYGATDFFGRDININVKDKSFNTQNPVKIFYKDSSIEANTMTMLPTSQIVELQGAVIATLQF